MPLLDRRLGVPRRSAEQLVERVVGHRQALAVVEVLHVQPEAAVGLDVDQMLRDQVPVDRAAVRRQSHQLVLAAVHLEAAVVGECGVQQPERMRKLQLACQRDLVAPPDAQRRRAPLADAVEGQDRGLVERARKERARGVALVMVGEDERRLRRRRRALAGSPSADAIFSLSHTGIAIAKLWNPGGAYAEVRLEQPLELAQRLLVEHDVVDVSRPSARPRAGSSRSRAPESRDRASFA